MCGTMRVTGRTYQPTPPPPQHRCRRRRGRRHRGWRPGCGPCPPAAPGPPGGGGSVTQRPEPGGRVSAQLAWAALGARRRRWAEQLSGRPRPLAISHRPRDRSYRACTYACPGVGGTPPRFPTPVRGGGSTGSGGRAKKAAQPPSLLLGEGGRGARALSRGERGGHVAGEVLGEGDVAVLIREGVEPEPEALRHRHHRLPGRQGAVPSRSTTIKG